jgi:menaquinone-dependent protoporphyrinogen IX oxidase
MKIGIVYATKRTAATVQIAGWMKCSLEEQGHTVICEKVDCFNDVGCDAYIVGSAVYGFTPRRAGMGRFLKQNAKVLAQKPISLFVVCGADPLPPREQSADTGLKKFLKYRFVNPDNYLKQLVRAFPAVTHSAIFKGYYDEEDKIKTGFEALQPRARAWARESVDRKL